MNWYYAQNNERHGPVSENEFDFLVHQKKIAPDALVWNETMKEWRPLREVLPEPEATPLPSIWDAPQPAAPPAPPERDGPAWEERDSIGGILAALETVKEMLRNSDRAFERMKRVADWAGPFCFALFLGCTGYFAKLIYGIMICRLGAGSLRWPVILLTSNYFAGFLVVAAYFFIPVFIALIVTLNSVLIHVSLMLLGGVKQPFQTTWRVVNYSLGASSALQFIPVLGLFLAPVWNLVLMINGIARMHDVSTRKATIALTPVVLYTSYFILLSLGIF